MAEGYNGWTNKETWLVYLWLSNDQASDTQWRAVGREVSNVRTFADVLQQEIEEGTETILSRSGLYTDLLNTALGRVDWTEVATHFLE
jgi:hypothetical protein